MKWTLIATWKMAAEGMRMAEANLQKSGSADQALETVISAVSFRWLFRTAESGGRRTIGRWLYER